MRYARFLALFKADYSTRGEAFLSLVYPTRSVIW
jgi:hypothetical protein